MKRKERGLALLICLCMGFSLTACGSEPNDSQSGATQGSGSAEEISSVLVPETGESEIDSEEESSSFSGDNAEKRDESSLPDDSGSKADSPSGDSHENSRPAEVPAESGAEGAFQGGDKPSKPSASQAESSRASELSSATEPGKPAEPSESADSEQTKPTKYISLKGTTAQYSGEGIEVNGGRITITKGGNYEISGTLSDGQITVLASKKKVQLYLNNAHITNKSGAAIFCQDAKRMTVSTLSGTKNSLEDGGEHDADKGTVFSEDTVIFEGEGELSILANYAHGVQGDDDIIVNSGTLRITSKKSGLHSNDAIEIHGGNLICDAGTNGIKTDGFITISGGKSVFLGGTREEKGAIYCDGAFTVTGGSFWALGNTCAIPVKSSTAPVVCLVFDKAQAGGSAVGLTRGGQTVFAASSPRGYKYAVYAGSGLEKGAQYMVTCGGVLSGGASPENFFAGAQISGGNSGGSFSSAENVMIYTIH